MHSEAPLRREYGLSKLEATIVSEAPRPCSMDETTDATSAYAF